MPHAPIQLASFVAVSALVLASAVAPAAAQSQIVSYSLSIAGLPIGSATLSLAPNGGSTALSLVAKVGGPFELGRVAASATVAQGQVTATSQSGSGKDATSAN
ncbi:MAG: hypothetical protein ACRCVZ_11435, partial [Aestuariivirga sp.]